MYLLHSEERNGQTPQKTLQGVFFCGLLRIQTVLIKFGVTIVNGQQYNIVMRSSIVHDCVMNEVKTNGTVVWLDTASRSPPRSPQVSRFYNSPNRKHP